MLLCASVVNGLCWYVARFIDLPVVNGFFYGCLVGVVNFMVISNVMRCCQFFMYLLSSCFILF